MTYTEFSAEVCAYLNRPASDLNRRGQDLVLNATNRARRHAQKLIDFEQLRCSVDITVDLETGGALSSAVLHGAAYAPIQINRIERAYLVSSQGEQRPIEFCTRSALASRLKRSYDNNLPWREWSRFNEAYIPTTPMLVRHGDRLHVWPHNLNQLAGTEGQSITVMLDVVRWARNIPTSYEIKGISTADAGPIGAATFTLTQIGVTNNFPFYGGITEAGLPQAVCLWADETKAYLSDQLFSAPYWVADHRGSVDPTTYTWSPFGFVANGSVRLNAPEQYDLAGFEEDIFLNDYSEWTQLQTLRYLEFYNKDKEHFVVTQTMLNSAWEAMIAQNNSISDSGSAQTYDLD